MLLEKIMDPRFVLQLSEEDLYNLVHVVHPNRQYELTPAQEDLRNNIYVAVTMYTGLKGD